MKPSVLQEGDERIFTLQDVKDLCFSLRKKVLQVALIGAALALIFTWMQPPAYKIEASFKEEAEKKESELALQTLLSNVSSGSQAPRAVVFMQSNQVLKPLVERLGLAAAVPQGKRLSRFYRQLRDCWLAERKKPMADPDPFVFQNVHYEGDEPCAYTLRFTDATHFGVLDGRGKSLASGTVGEETLLTACRFTLVSAPTHLRLHRRYSLVISPWMGVAASLRQGLKIVSGKINSSIYNLSLFHRDRHLGVRIVNELMAEYQRYLKQEHDQISMDQLAYLSLKQEQIFQRLSKVFEEHATYFADSLRNKGAMGWGSDTWQPLQQMMQKRVGIDVELARLNHFQEEGKRFVPLEDSPISKNLAALFSLVADLEQKRDLIQLSLQQRLCTDDAQLDVQQQELNVVRARKEETLQLLAALEEGGREPETFSFEPEQALAVWVKRLDRGTPQQKEDLSGYIDNHLRLLSMQEKMLQEPFCHSDDGSHDFAGLDLHTLQKLIIAYLEKLDAAQTVTNYYGELQKEINRDDFELGSLSATLKDALSQELIRAGSALVIRLKDETHRTTKEAERWQDELNLQKAMLREHLKQLQRVEQLSMDLVNKRVATLQQSALNGIQTQIAVLLEQVKSTYKEKKEALLQEKKVLDTLLVDWREQASIELPEQWRHEKWTKLQTEIETRIVETLTQLVESKSISHHLHHVQSRPLDIAQVPFIPQKPGLFNKAFLGAFGSGFLFLFWHLIRRIIQGFPTSLSKLQAMRYPVMGKVSSGLEEDGDPTGPDLEVLRRIGLFLEERSGKLIGLLAGQGPDYSCALAKNLAQKGLRPAVVRCDFPAKFSQDDVPGLLQLWKGELQGLPLRSHPDFDLVPSGGFTPYSAEVFQSERIRTQLQALKEKYPIVLILFRAPLSSAQSMAALRLCDQALVTVSAEPTEQLTPFIDWAYDEKGQNRLAFVVRT